MKALKIEKFKIVLKLKINNLKLRRVLGTLFFVVFLNLSLFQFASASSFPLKANFYLKWELTEPQARALSKWDLLILDTEIQASRPDLLGKMKQWNPDIILLAYITPQEIKNDAAGSSSAMRRKLAAGIFDEWYLKDSRGDKLSWWQGTTLLNVTDGARPRNGQRWNEYLSQFMAKEVLSTGLWDGVFYDNAWDSVTHFVGADVDVNGDALADADADAQWKAGMKKIYSQTRQLTGGKYLIVGNGTTREFTGELNGKLIENFNPSFWEAIMNTYELNFQSGPNPRVNIINANTANTGQSDNYKKMRFGLTSALLENGYFSFDYGDKDHGQLWWYDEYDVDLGRPTGAAMSQAGNTAYKSGVWQRDFEHGAVALNSADSGQTVDLGGEYEKLRGRQDASANDGSIVSELELAAKDGRLLLKTFATVNDAMFRNGDFVRFLRPDGSKARSGFFVFDSGYEGGVQLAHVDLDGNGARDTLAVSKGKLEAWRDDGLILIRSFPYTAEYDKDVKVAIGDLDNDGRRMELVVAPAKGASAPVKIYHYDGSPVLENWYPFGKTHKGGMSVAIGDDKGRGHLVIGSGIGKEPRVLVYNDKFKLIRSWLAFERGFFGGVNVAVGDIDGLPGNEIIVGAGQGKGPVIKIFDFFGKQLYPEFLAYDTMSKSGVEVSAVDVDFDGRAEIIAQSSGF